VLIEYAEWMHRHRYDPQDVEDMLLLAVDLLMDIEPGWDDEDDEMAGEVDEGKTKKTGRSGSSRSRHSAAQSKAHTRKSGAKSMKKSVAGKSRVSKATMRSKSLARSGASRTSKKTTTALQKRQEEEGQPMYLNCSHFDKLIRIHSMLAMLAADATKQREYALDGHFFVMKMWEQSFFALNATAFFEQNAAELQELGFVADDQGSRREYYAEVIGGGEMQVPLEHSLPEKPEDWVNFEVPGEYYTRSTEHEDKIMVAKYTFVKPELTFLHLKKVATLLEEHYFHIQMLPVLKMLELFSREVLGDPVMEQTHVLARSRLLYNLGLREQGQALAQQAEEGKYTLTEEECKVNYEKIKALKDPSDDLQEGTTIPFAPEDGMEPLVVESIRTHESWLAYAEELLKWGDFARAKDLVKEASLHARILQDQNAYAKSLLLLGTIAYLEGDSANALRTAMACQRYAKDIQLVEQSIVHTFNLLYQFEKYEDCGRLLNPALEMLVGLRKAREVDHNNSTSMIGGKGGSENQVNLELEFAISTTLLLRATLFLKQSQNPKLGAEDREALILNSFAQAEQFDQQVHAIGFKEQHILLLLKYSKILWQEVVSSTITDADSVQAIKAKLQQCALYLLKAQEYLSNQVYYIGVHQESARQLSISLPLLRLLGVTKLRVAQVNTAIGVIKNTLKGGQGKGSVGGKKDPKDKIRDNYLDAITKQIDAQSNTYKQKMNRYEKSISILFSALNLLHPHCDEYAEIQVEIAKNRRLLAVNKKHLRGQWRQDALEVDQLNLDTAQAGAEDRKEQLEAKGLEGEVGDEYVNYKQEMLQSFVDLLHNQVGTSEEPNKSTFDRILALIGENSNENILGTFAVEFAEGRANLNREQAFYYLSLYQYSVSR